jgi:TPR repeat protein
MLYFCGLYTAKDERLANIYFRYATSLKHPGAALMYAAYLASQEKMDEKEIFSVLEIVFKYGMIDDYLRINYEIIEDSFDGKVCEKVKELAKKYWNITKGQA